jgi:hypothetical protein
MIMNVILCTLVIDCDESKCSTEGEQPSLRMSPEPKLVEKQGLGSNIILNSPTVH